MTETIKSRKINPMGRQVLGRGLNSLISRPVVSLGSYRDGNLAEQVESEGDATPQREIEKAPIAVAASAQNSTAIRPDGEKIRFVAISSIVANPSQPRKVFDQGELKELSESIKNLGVLQPLLVRPAKIRGEGVFEIVAGERRWRASQIANLEQVPVIIKELSDWESLEIALVENVQRANLNPIDEAEAYQSLMDQYSLTQQDVADRIGKDRVTVANFLRLLKLAPDVVNMVRQAALTVGHAKVIMGVKEPAAQLSLAKKVLEEGISVRSLEALVSQAAVLDGQKQAALKGKSIGIGGSKVNVSSANFPDVLDRLRKALGTKVAIQHHKSGRGKIVVEYFSEAELDRLIDRLCDGV